MINLFYQYWKQRKIKVFFEDLYLKHRQSMYAVAYSILNNVEDSEDAVHHAFLIIADNFEKVKSIPHHRIKSCIVIIV